MKKIKFLTLLVFCSLSIVLTSCLGDDNNDNRLSDAQIAQCINNIKGDYDGYLIYQSQNPNVTTDKTDSIDISWRIHRTDTAVILSVYDFPPTLIANSLADGDVKSALKSSQATTVNSVIAFFQDTPSIGFLIYPMPAKFNITYGGSTHELSAYFYSNQYSFGYHSSANKQMRMQIVLGGVYLDGNLDKNLVQSEIPFILDSKW